MIRGYVAQGNRLVAADLNEVPLRAMAWIDLEAPTVADEDAVEAALGIEIPTREDMAEIEPSSRIYFENGVLYLTAQILASRVANDPRELDIAPVTFMLQRDRLVTVHYHHPGSFGFFADWAARHDTGCETGAGTFLGLMESVVDRLADILEGEARRLDYLSKTIFEAHRPDGKAETLTVVLQRIGKAEDQNGKVGESLATIQRLLGFLSTPAVQGAKEALKKMERDQLKSLVHDVRSLREVALVQAEKIRFQLDATLGVINIRQSDIIKVFSVVAFVFLPPTLIASIYGMNFEYMPELKWPWGYPLALFMMLISAVVPWMIFRWKKWL